MGLFRSAKAMSPVRVALAASALVLLAAAPALAQRQILPADFFQMLPRPAGDNIAVAADVLTFDQVNQIVTAEGNVGIIFDGIRATADQVVYDLDTGSVELVGNVSVLDTDGVEYVADRVELEGDFRVGMLEALTVAFPDGTYFSASTTSIDNEVRTYSDAIYSPCGTCIDDEGRRIGWQVKSVEIITDDGENVIYFEQPSLELLGFPVLWLPYLSLQRDGDVDFPILGYKEEYGVRASFPFFRYRINGGRLLLTPSLFSRQGAMLGAEWSQTVGDFEYELEASTIYQLDPGAYTGLAERGLRYALQGEFTFTPFDDWTFGGEGLLVSDPAYLRDYDYASGTARNQLYATYFTEDSYLDIRTQQFVPLSNAATWDAYEQVQGRQPITFPNARGDHVTDLADGWGQVRFDGSLLALSREFDQTGPLQTGWAYAGDSVHAMGQASWTNHVVLPGGVLLSPTLGLRADAASYSGDAMLTQCGVGNAAWDAGRFCSDYPGAQSLFALTPIAALDARYPIAFSGEDVTTIVEPIAQIVYRGSDESLPGITNNDSHGVVIDSANLFDFDRFAGSDRQETGLRANYGAQAMTQFSNGAWVNFVAGQSIQLAGTNAFAISDGTYTGLASGLDATESYVVAGLSAGFAPYLSAGAKAQFDPGDGEIQRLLATAETSFADIDIGLTYIFSSGDGYNDSDASLPIYADRHEVAIDASVPIADYWFLNGGLSWDLSASSFLQATAGVEYNDGYLAYGVEGRITGPTHSSPEELRVLFNLRLSLARNQELIDLEYAYEPEPF